MADKELKEKAEEIRDAVEEKAEAVKDAVEEKVDAAKDVVEDKAEEVTEAAEETKMHASTEANRRKKAERREAKAARKEANKIEEKKKRPNNIVLAALIFGVLIIMFAFAGGYNYFSKPANIESYVKDQGIADIYNDTPVSGHTTLKVRGEDNTLKVLFTVAEDAPEEELEQFKGEDGTKYLKDVGASFLTSIKPNVRGLGATVKVGVKQGDKTINYVKMSYSEAKKYVKEAEKEAQKEAEEAADDTGDAASDEAAGDAGDAASETGDAAGDAASETDDAAGDAASETDDAAAETEGE